mgnify:CR=1 FL=1
MYTNYFGLTELPFSIAPNPDFLFMSDRHREALTHLTYGLGETGGFVLLTGEVGTGKTTVSRCLLEQIPENTQVAFILNPTLSSQELLATICDELKIRYRKTGATLKTLTDKIQEKLLKNHGSGINTILIIDEAQHLQPEVLEQLRLLTNLETNTKKLLQVILIGQPELQQLLQRQDLRQLAQRITARYHLMPLTKAEVAQYIKHRLDVAKCPRMLFDDKAMQHIHKLSNGIPRLINLLCDRALLKAYGTNQTLVNKKTVISASFEALGQQEQQPQWSQQSMTKALVSVAATVAVLVGGALFTGFWFANQQTAVVVNNPSTVEETKAAQIPLEETQAQLSEGKIAPQSNKQTNNSGIVQAPNNNNNMQADTPSTNEQEGLSIDMVIDGDKTTITKTSPQSSKLEEPKEQAQRTAQINDKTAPLPEASAEFKVAPTEGVSDELLTLFQTAIEETERLQASDEQSDNNPPTSTNVKPLMDMPQWVQDGVPSLDFQMHLYESDGRGSVKVNGERKKVGDFIANTVEIIAIERQHVRRASIGKSMAYLQDSVTHASKRFFDKNFD